MCRRRSKVKGSGSRDADRPDHRSCTGSALACRRRHSATHHTVNLRTLNQLPGIAGGQRSEKSAPPLLLPKSSETKDLPVSLRGSGVRLKNRRPSVLPMTGCSTPPSYPEDLVAEEQVYDLARRGSESDDLKLHELGRSLRFGRNGNECDTINKAPSPPTKGQPNRKQQYR
jgi:hypothetical protein